MEKLIKMTQDNPFIRALELKLSQGAKPGKGGVLPASKSLKKLQTYVISRWEKMLFRQPITLLFYHT
jgi:hypothetical protein